MTQRIGRRSMVGLTVALATLPRPSRAAIPADRLRIGVLTDLTGPYAIDTGHGSLIAARLAVDDAMRGGLGIEVELLEADHGGIPAKAAAIAVDWIERQGVAMILDVPMSNAAREVVRLVEAHDRVALFSGAASADLTGTGCGANHAHWTYDTWALAAGTGRTLVAEGGKSWFFITTDDAFGHRLQDDTTSFVTAAGGEVVGSYATPFPTGDYSAALVEAVASRAAVIGLANAGTDAIACVRQAGQFSVTSGGQRLAGLLFQLPDVHEVGLDQARGLVTTEAFYWDRDDASRDFAARYAGGGGDGKPGMVHAGCYSATLHYLRAASQLGADAARRSGRAVLARMKAMPTDDPLFGHGVLRQDGRHVHDMYLFEVKTPMESRYPWDYYKLRRVIPAADAFRPMSAGGCPLVKA
jgi:branched-chain amino acid transport system substrate-binding protein